MGKSPRYILPLIWLFFVYSQEVFAQFDYKYHCDGKGFFLGLNGTSQYAEAQNYLYFQPQSITLACWVRNSAKQPSGVEAGLFYRHWYTYTNKSYNPEYGLVINTRGEYMFRARVDPTPNPYPSDGNTGFLDSLSSGVVADTINFHHIAVTLDKTTLQCLFYVDGQVTASKKMGGAILETVDVGGNPYSSSIGCVSMTYQGTFYHYNYFKGYLDDVAVSNNAMTKEQIDTMANVANLSFDQITGYALFGYWQFSESTPSNVTANSNSYVVSNSGVGRNAYLFGSPTWYYCAAANPVANAGPNQTIFLPRDTAILNGSASTVPPGNGTLKYLWSQISGPAQSLIAKPSNVITPVAPLKKGIYVFQLLVTDSLGKKDSAKIQVTVQPAWCYKDDSTALVDLFNNANGISWINKSGWKSSTPVRNWTGVTLSDDSGRVTNLLLNNNNLRDTIPLSFAGLDHLTNLALGSNRLTFASLETVAKKFNGMSTYVPQDSIQIDTSKGKLIVHAGGSLANNTYKWYINGKPDTTIVGDSTLKITGGGEYYALVSNNIASQLTLTTKKIQLIDSLPNISLLDPVLQNPGIIKFGGEISTDLAGIDPSKTVLGGVTDGVTKILLYGKSNSPVTFILTNSTDGKLSAINDQGNPTTDRITIQPINGKIACLYTVPDGYGVNNPPGGRDIYILEQDPKNIINYKPISLRVITPPVVLVHGMWSRPQVWQEGGFATRLLKDSIFSFAADYATHSSVTFDPYDDESRYGRNAIRTQISKAIDFTRQKKFAIDQVDIIGHSLGGLMTRSFSQTDDPGILDDYYKGLIHKLITLGTPHKGSPLGPALYKNQVKWVKIGTGGKWDLPISIAGIFDFAGKPVGLCHRDFDENFVVLQNNVKASLPFYTYAVAGDYLYNLTNMISYQGLDAVLQIITDNTHASIFKIPQCSQTDESASDIIVPRYSQIGGNNKFGLFKGTAHSGIIPVFPGVIETNNPIIQDSVSHLLLSNDLQNFSRGFIKPSQITDDCSVPGNRTSSDSKSKYLPKMFSQGENQRALNYEGTQQIKLTSPANGQTMIQTDSVSLNISYMPLGGCVPKVAALIIQELGWFKLSENAPYQTTINLSPNSIIGNLHLVLLVKDSSGLLLADTSTITVLPSGKLEEIIVSPTPIKLDSNYRIASVAVRGKFSKGNAFSFADISKQSSGTIYSSNKPNTIFAVSKDGVITANRPGVDTLIVSNSNLNVKSLVIVDANYSSAQLYPNSIVFETVPDKKLEDPPIVLTASSPAAEPIVYSIVTGNVTLQNGVVIINGPGKVIIKATQSGNAYFAPAQPVYDTFCVSPSRVGTITGDTVVCGGIRSYAVEKMNGAIHHWSVSEGGTVIANDTIASVNWIDSGFHMITVYAATADGCSGASKQIRVYVKMPQRPIVSSNSNLNFCLGDSAILNTASVGALQWFRDTIAITGANSPRLAVGQSGNYYVTKKDTDNCIATSLPLQVRTNPLPVKPMIAGGNSQSFCNGDTLILTSTASNTIQWFKDQIALPGSAQPRHFATVAGKYYLIVKDSNQCMISSDTVNVVMNEKPVRPVISSNGDSLISTAITGNQWYLNDTLITGANSKAWIPLKPGQYSVIVTINGCSSPASAKITFTIPSAVLVLKGDTAVCLGEHTYSVIRQKNTAYSWRVSTGNSIQAFDTSAIVNWRVPGTNSLSVTAVSNAVVTGIKQVPVTVSSFATPGKPRISLFNNVLVSTSISGNQWYRNDTLIVGATQYLYPPTGPATYTVRTTNGDCRSDFSDPYVIAAPAINEPAVSVYPNPATNILTLVNQNVHPLRLQLVDPSGRLVYKNEHVSVNLQLDVAHFAKGTYVFVITDESTGKSARIKVIKQ